MILPLQVKAGLCAVALLGAGYVGWHERGLRCENEKAKAVQAALQHADEQRANIHEQANDYEHDRQANQVATQARQGQVRVIYRDRTVDPGCEPPADANRLLDDAIRSANTAAGGSTGATVPPASGETVTKH